jgi:hypothetical protein
MAEILDTEVVLISRKAIAIMTSLFAYIDLFAPMHVSFTMYLLTGSSAVRYATFFLFNPYEFRSKLSFIKIILSLFNVQVK